MAQPNPAAIEIDERKRDRDGDECEHPTQQSPVRIRFGEEANGKKKRGAQKDERNWNRRGSARHGKGSIPPTFPKQVKGKERNDEAIIVLGIKPPFGFELVDQLEPSKAEDDEHEQPTCFFGARDRNSGWLRNGLLHFGHSVTEHEQLASRLEAPPATGMPRA